MKETLLTERDYWKISIGLIAENPWFGGVDFYNAQEMQELKWGNGLIDAVLTSV